LLDSSDININLLISTSPLKQLKFIYYLYSIGQTILKVKRYFKSFYIYLLYYIVTVNKSLRHFSIYTITYIVVGRKLAWIYVFTVIITNNNKQQQYTTLNNNINQ